MRNNRIKLRKTQTRCLHHSSKAGFRMVSLTYPASITTGQLYRNFNDHRTLLTESIFPPVRWPVYLLIILRLFKYTISTAEAIAYDVELNVKLIMKGK